MISTIPLEIIGINEIWVDTVGRVFEGEYCLPGYSLLHQDRVGRAGGGVVLYKKRYLNPVQIPILTPFEIVVAEVRRSEPRVQFLSATGPQNILWMLISVSTNLCRPWFGRKPPSWWGTLTVPGVEWETDFAMEEGLRLLDFKQDNFLSEMVQEPTRGTNVIDFIFSTEDDLVSEVLVGESSAGRNHHMVWYTVGANTGPEVERPTTITLFGISIFILSIRLKSKSMARKKLSK